LIQAVVFDFDGTILDTESLWYASFRDVCARYGVELPLAVFAQGIGTYDERMFQYILERVESEDTLASIKQHAIEQHHQLVQSIQPRNGVKQYLEEARLLKLRIGLATSSPRRWVEPFLASHGLLDYFETLCTADDVTKIKPDPELYTLAAERLGVQPAVSLAFEDSANGARSAAAAGYKVVIVPNPVTEQLIFERYDLRIPSMADLRLTDVLKQLN
jgi:putative hydrolase of the HAD superfamily